jgi:hypothetical protein
MVSHDGCMCFKNETLRNLSGINIVLGHVSICGGSSVSSHQCMREAVYSETRHAVTFDQFDWTALLSVACFQFPTTALPIVRSFGVPEAVSVCRTLIYIAVSQAPSAPNDDSFVVLL